MRAVRLVNVLAGELSDGRRLVAVGQDGEAVRILIPELELGRGWVYLTERPHPWRRQLWIKGRKLMASTIWNEIYANGMTDEEAAEDRDLPI